MSNSANFNINEAYGKMELKEIEEVSKRVRNLEDENTLSFIFLTDLHLNQVNPRELNAYSKDIKAIKEIIKNTHIKGVYFGGDNTYELGSRIDLLKNHQYVRDELLKEIDVPLIITKGNHDDKSINGRIDPNRPCPCRPISFISDTELYERYNLQNRGKENITLGPDGLYGYVDYKMEKIRVLFLNSIDVPYKLTKEGYIKYPGQWCFGYRNEQLKFIGRALEELPEGYQVVLISHIAIDTNPLYEGDGIKNNDALVGMLKAFQNGTSYRAKGGAADFEYELSLSFKGKGTIIAFMAGHNHIDVDSMYEGIQCFSTKKAHWEINSDGASANIEGGVDYTAFDVVTISPKKRKINLTRYGLGHDREFNY